MHLFLQKINFKEEYDLDKLKELKEKLIMNKIITQEEGKYVNILKAQKFLESNIAKKIKKSDKIEKEKAFCTKINAKEFFEDAENETILVQGIIDLYAIDKNNNIILLDYKTDYVEENSESVLIEKYKKQLALYKRALEDGLNLNVKEVYIYSLYLNKEILVEV